MRRRAIAAVLAWGMLAGGAAAADKLPLEYQQQNEAASKLKAALSDTHVLAADFWVYNDLAAAKARAAKENKPIFVTFRCVPCKACKGFDAEVAKGADRIAALAREKFVSLRQVEMKGVDLSQFQFDYDLNWAAMFINPDGTVYARYGTQSAEGPDAYNSITSLTKTMERVLDLHKNYEQVKASLAAKRGADKPYKTGLDMPGMENKEKLAGPTARNNCIHCHMVNDALHRQWQKEGTFDVKKMWRYPLPENIGLRIVRDDGRKIEKVLSGGAAEKAGLQAADVLTHAAGQPVTSIADLQWVLENLPPGDATVDLTVDRGGQAVTKTLALAGDWKKTDFTWRGSRWSVRPEPGFWAPALTEKEIKALGNKVPEGARPLRVQFMNGQRAQGRATQQAGLKIGDVIVSLDGRPLRWDPPDFQMHVRFERKVGETLKFGILRNGRAMEIAVPLVE